MAKLLKATQRIVNRLTKLALMGGFFGVVAISVQKSGQPSTLERILASGELHVISRNGPTTYYEGPHGYTGFEYTLAKAFAKHLGVKLVIEEEEDLSRMLNSVGSERGDLAAAGLTITERRQQKIRFTQPYLNVTQELIYRAGQERPQTIEDLYGKSIVVIGNSSHAENLRSLQRQYPQLQWQEAFDLEMMDLLEMVHSGEIDYTIVDSNAYDINSSLYPNARKAFSISEPQGLAWAFPKNKDTSLYIAAQHFFDVVVPKKKLLKNAMETFYGHLGELNFGGALVFTERLNTRLPKWRELLQQAATENNLDWQLLAALSYQESHWNPRAVSRTGVRGFMMLTRTTAKSLGIKNRTNAKQSIKGGAEYFKKILDRIPEHIEPPDRTYFALAAYNIGFGHMEDARVLTERHGGDPDKWVDVRDNLELLAKRKYYKHTKHGYARGWEAVEYVQNIRNFYNIIAWNEKEKIQQLAQHDAPKYEQFSAVVSDAVASISGQTSKL